MSLRECFEILCQVLRNNGRPLTIIGAAASGTSIIEALAKTVSKLHGLHSQLKQTHFTFINLTAHFTAHKALQHVSAVLSPDKTFIAKSDTLLLKQSSTKTMDISADRAQWEKHLSHYIQGSTGEIGGDYDFTIICNTKRFVVTVSPSTDPDDKARLLLSRYSEACRADDEEQIQNVQDAIDDMIYEAGQRIFAQLAPSPENEAPEFPKNLYSDLYPETFSFRLAVVGGNIRIVQKCSPQQQNRHFHLTIEDGFDWPKYLARNIAVTNKLMGTGYIARVSVNGQDMCCKIGTTTWGTAIQREYECLQKIAMSENASSIRVPKLVGFVVGNDGYTIGILEEFIPHEFTLGRVKGGIAAVPNEQRKKWAVQIGQTVDQLHELGVAWGGVVNQTTFSFILKLMIVGWLISGAAGRMVGWMQN